MWIKWEEKSKEPGGERRRGNGSVISFFTMRKYNSENYTPEIDKEFLSKNNKTVTQSHEKNISTTCGHKEKIDYQTILCEGRKHSIISDEADT